MKSAFRKLQERTGVKFSNAALLRQAFTHTSYVNEHRASRAADNERLEFLGDAVLQLAVSEHLYERYPHRSEGELTRMRANIVCEASLFRFAEALGFGQAVLLGKGEELTGGRSRPSLLADAFEAFIGALYLDQGMDEVRKFLERHLFPLLSQDEQEPTKDYKSILQEKVQQMGHGLLEYKIVEERGPAHAREFVAAAIVGQKMLGTGSGRTKKEAEQKAASAALRALEEGMDLRESGQRDEV